MKTLPLVALAMIFLPAIAKSSDAVPPVILAEAVNSVVLSESRTGNGEPVRDKAIVPPSKFVRTGAGSRGHIDLADGGIVRIGADTSVELDRLADTFTLWSGVALFEKLKAGRGLVVPHGGTKVAIWGDIGFVNLTEGGREQPNVLVIGGLAGTVTVKANGRTYRLEAGELLALGDNGQHVDGNFDLPKLLNTSPLIAGFSTPLSSKAALEREARRYASLRRRGFIRPNGGVGIDQQLVRNGIRMEVGAVTLAGAGTSALAALNSSGLAGASSFGSFGLVFETLRLNDPPLPLPPTPLNPVPTP